ncbi:MAG: AAA family ATPase [Nitrososphaerota archaeon]|nr:ATP-binding protein [Candidatus Bathyarchaeota archaeon]MDW8023373.1 AAA family ATPase [Nitrososphaerota archaeon]
MGGGLKGLWNVVLSGYPRSGKTTLAKRLVADYTYFARVSVDQLREMLFYEAFPCRDEFLVYSLIAEIRDALLRRSYSVVIDSTAPDNVTRQFLLTSRVMRVNSLLVVLNVEREILIKRSIEKFGNSGPVAAYDKRWENPKGGIAVFKFKSNTPEEFEAYYARLKELLESETHPFKPEFHPRLSTLKEIRRALENLLKRSSEPRHS